MEKGYREKELLNVSNKLFGDRKTLLSLWQTIAENFYVERAAFTVKRDIGEEFADHLTTSYPMLARRELGNTLSSMLRPRDQQWFFMRPGYGESTDVAADRWLERSSIIQKRAMYDRASGFVRATKEGDNDFVTFGQCVISTQMNWAQEALVYRCHHLRDTAWTEDAAGNVDRVDYRWKARACDLVRNNSFDVHPRVKEMYEKDNYCEVNVRHVVIPSEMYESSYKEGKNGAYKRYPQPFVSIYIDVDNCHIMEEKGSWTRIYTIPRWQTVSDSQYSYSPCTTIALPDARLMQAIALTLQEAGEMYVRPPMLAVQEAIREDVQLFSGGITWVDAAYDERLGEVLRPLTQDKGGFNIGFNMQEEMRRSIAESFFLNKLSLPDTGSRRMTEYEVSQRVQEYVRNALPLFEPAEHDYNGSLCEITFETLLRAGAFGPNEEIPPSIAGREIMFKFESPIHQAEERLKGQMFMQAKGLIAEALALDPSSANIIDIKAALRDSIRGMRAPAAWMRSDQEVEDIEAAAQEQQQAQELLGALDQGATVAEKIGKAGQALQNIEASGV